MHSDYLYLQIENFHFRKLPSKIVFFLKIAKKKCVYASVTKNKLNELFF